MKRAVVVVLFAAGTALANPKAAAVHDKQGKAYFDAKQYDAAIGEFKKSYDLNAKPLTLFKIASAYYAKGDYENAIAFYGQYLQADPEGPYAAQALEFTTIAKKALDDARAAKQAAEDAARKAEEDKRKAEELEKRRAEAAARVKNAQAFAQAGAWGSAGDEYRAATEIGGDPSHLLAAADAYTKQPDHGKAASAYRTYLALKPDDDGARRKLAESTRLLEEAEAKKRVAVVEPTRDEPKPDPGPPPITKGVSSYGPRVAAGFSQPDTNPLMMKSSEGLVAGPSFDAGVFARYQLHARVALRPEASFSYRNLSFDAQTGPMQPTIDSAVTIKRMGLTLALPIYASLQQRDGLRLGVGPFVSALPYFKANTNGGFAFDAGGGNKLDYGLLAGVEFDFGLVALDLRFSKSFGTHSESVDATMYTLLAGLNFGFEPAR